MLNWLIEILNSIPSTFWGIAFGSFISLSGVVVSNRASDRRQDRQLKHDRDQKNRERELSLRKEIYLTAAEGIAVGINSLVKFANLDITFEEITTEYSAKSPAIYKIQVIAKESTAEAIINVTAELSAAFLRLSAKRIPLAQQKARIKILEEQRKSFESVRDNMLELLRQHNINVDNNQQKFAVIQRNFEFEAQRIDAAIKEQNDLSVDLLRKQLAFVKECIGETTEINKIMVPALVAIRAELELPIDQAKYMMLVEANIKRQEEVLTEFIKQVQRA